MRGKLGETIGVVFSFPLVVTARVSPKNIYVYLCYYIANQLARVIR